MLMLETTLGSGRGYLDTLRSYVGMTAEGEDLLRRMHPVVLPHLDRIMEDFYATIREHPAARAAITGGQAQIARLKVTLRRWLEEMLLGPMDQAYLERRARIGRVHVQIGLPQFYMFTAMNRIRVQVAELIGEALKEEPAGRERTLLALHQSIDIELAIMMETYREDLEAKSHAAGQLATVGQFAAGIGHELRNPLSVIESSIYLVRQRLTHGGGVIDPHVLRHLDKIAGEIRRSTSTINDLMDLARGAPVKRRAMSLHTLCERAIADASLPAEVEVVLKALPDVTATLDPSQIGRVLNNLLTNANQAMKGTGKIWVDAEQTGGETRIRVRDDGPGVPIEARSRIFDALFTTKAKGTGLGLALCRRIAEAHGGRVTLEPSARGATFLVCLPEREERPRS